jgi:hypothetical protein
MSLSASYVMMSCCICGHQDDFEAFCSTPISGELPKGTHQCPKCNRAWRMEPITKGCLLESGLYIPPKRKSVTIPSFL